MKTVELLALREGNLRLVPKLYFTRYIMRLRFSHVWVMLELSYSLDSLPVIALMSFRHNVSAWKLATAWL